MNEVRQEEKGLLWRVLRLLFVVAAAIAVALTLRAALGLDDYKLPERLESQPLIETNSAFVLKPVASASQFSKTYSISVSNANASGYVPQLLDNGVNSLTSEFFPQTNGSYVVVWDTLVVSYGLHLLQFCQSGVDTKIYGPTRTEFVTNLVEFNPSLTSFGSKACIYGRLHVLSADYRIVIYDASTNVLKNISGYTDRGVIDEIWDLKTADGMLRDDQEFYAVVYIKPVASGAKHQDDSNMTHYLSFPYGWYRTGKAGLGLAK